MFNQEMKVYVVKNTIPEKRTGEYLLVFQRSAYANSPNEKVLAFGLSHADAVRAQKNGAGYLGEADAKHLLNKVED